MSTRHATGILTMTKPDGSIRVKFGRKEGDRNDALLRSALDAAGQSGRGDGVCPACGVSGTWTRETTAVYVFNNGSSRPHACPAVIARNTEAMVGGAP